MADSPEYKYLEKVSADIIACIEQAPGDVAIQLRPYGLLARKDIRYLDNPQHDEDQKAKRLVEVMLQKVEEDPQTYYIFIQALKAAGRWTKAAVSKLEQIKSTAATSTTVTHPPVQPGTGQVAVPKGASTQIPNVPDIVKSQQKYSAPQPQLSSTVGGLKQETVFPFYQPQSQLAAGTTTVSVIRSAWCYQISH